MKKLFSVLLMLALFFTANAHTLTQGCWSNGNFTLFIIAGTFNGSVKITVYDGTIPRPSFTVNLSATGNATANISQPIRTTTHYVKVEWFNNIAQTISTNWSHSYLLLNGNATSCTCNVSSITTGVNSCTSLALYNTQIDAKQDGNSTIITFSTDSDEESNSITVNYFMPDGTQKHFNIIFLDKLKSTDVWIIKIDNTSGKYTVTKR